MDELQAVVDVNNPDIVCITESWLKPDIQDSTVRLSKYILFRRDRPTHAGGVYAYVNSDIPCLRVSEFEFPEIESIWIKARPHRLSRLVSMILIGTIYHPPDSCQEDNLRLLRHIQENVDQFLRDHPEGLVLVSGDFNPTSTGITELTTKRVTGLTQIIKVLTKDTGTLDWCLTNRSKLMASPKQLPKLGKSDHYSVFIFPAQSPTVSKNTKKTIEKRDLRPSRLR